MILKRFLKINYLVFLVSLLGFIVRIWKVDIYPPSLLVDEVSIGYNAFSLLKTGKDEWGRSFPVIFQAYGDYKLPLYIYLTMFNVLFFGLNAFAVRFTSVLSGTLLIPVTYLISLKITGDKRMAFCSSFLIAFSPWAIMLSRFGIEANLSCLLFACGIYFMIKWFEKEKITFIAVCAIFFGLAVHAYNSSRILIPLISVFIFAEGYLRKKWKSVIIYAILLFLFLAPVVYQFIAGAGLSRMKQESFIYRPNLSVSKIEEADLYYPWPKWINRIIFSLPLYFVYETFGNLSSNLSLTYLFKNNEDWIQHWLYPKYNLLFGMTAPFMFLGIIICLFGKKIRYRFLLAWLILGFLPSAIMNDRFHALRSILILPVLMIFTALGLIRLYDLSKIILFKNRYRLCLVVAVLSMYFLFFVNWWNFYWNDYARENSTSMQYGYRELINKLKTYYPYYDKILITIYYDYLEPHEYILFEWPWDPYQYQHDKNFLSGYRDSTRTWIDVKAFDKFQFVSSGIYGISNDANILEEAHKIRNQHAGYNLLLVLKDENNSEKLEFLEKINDLEGVTVFVLYNLLK